jgi:hypothetical protein
MQIVATINLRLIRLHYERELIFGQMRHIQLIIFIVLTLVFSCKKESFTDSPNAKLSTSVDTIHFDTVFTSVGSVTQYFKIFNENDQKLRLSTVQLGGGINSVFKINVDGIEGPKVSNIEVEPNDSVYVFVTAKVDPTTTNLPFIVQDSVSIEFNGTKKWVQLEAWAQNANFYRSRLITNNETWVNNKPYIILGGLHVAPGITLTIDKGVRIYVHADAPLIIDGTLKVMGEKYDSTRVIFSGDRLDVPYRDFPASWPGIYFRAGSQDNQLNYAIIKNAYQGIVADQPSVNTNPKILLNECIIDNCYDAGLIAIRSDISARNCLISNCGKNLALVHGGKYEFTHCTAVSISNNFIAHKEPVLAIANFIKEGNNTLTADLSAVFRNCIFWGENSSVEDEVVVAKQNGSGFQVTFENCLWKVKTDPSTIGVITSNMVVNQNPAFDSVNTQRNFYSFRLKQGSPAINKGVPTTVTSDLDGNTRVGSIPDLGAYENH